MKWHVPFAQDKRTSAMLLTLLVGLALGSCLAAAQPIPSMLACGALVLAAFALDTLLCVGPLTSRLAHEQQAAASARALLHMALGSIDTALIILDHTGVITLANDAAQRMFGADLAALPITTFVPGFALTAAAPAPSAASGQRADGITFPLALAVTRTMIAGQAVLAVAVRDLTAPHTAGAAPCMGEERYHTLVSALAEGIVLQHADGSIQACNPSAERILGLTADQIMGRTSIDPRWRAIHPDGTDFPGEDHPAMVALRTGIPVESVIMGIHKPNGEQAWLAVNAQPLRHPGENTPYAVVTAFGDVTVQRQIERELRFQKTLLECQSEASPDGILVVSPDRRWLYVNQRFVAMWRLDAAVVAHATSAAGVPAMVAQASDPARLHASIEALYQTPEASGSGQAALKDGRVIAWFSAPVRSSDGTSYGRVWYYQDVTAREAIDRAKREFVAVVSHELRTPLTAISGALNIVASGAAGDLPARACGMVEIAHKNSAQLIRLINDILDSEKLEAAAMPFAMHPLLLAPMVAQALDANQPYAAMFGVTLTASGAADALWVNADSDRLIQVLTNLLANAIKFSPRDGMVTVQVANSGGSARIAIRDQGDGIPTAFQQRIFQKFAQADTSDTRRTGGTGLGLHITRTLVEHMGGQISFTTGSGGTTFNVDLPLVASAPSACTHAAPQRVLICEDDPHIADLIELLAQDAGFATEVAATARELRAKLAHGSYDCLTLDINLPDGNGIALIRELRATPQTEYLPIVIVSALARTTLAEVGPIPGVDWVEKPFTREQLLAAISGKKRPHVLHVEDDIDVVRSTASILQAVATITHCTTLGGAIDLLGREHFDAILLDLSLPDGAGLDLLPLVQRTAPTTPVVVFSVQDAVVPDYVETLLVKSRTSNQQLLRVVADLVATRS